MKKIISLSLLAALFSLHAFAQKPAEDKTKRPSPPATVSQEIPGGAQVTINYSQPSVKGRAIGKDIEPMEGKVWRTGANEATIFETSKAITVNGSSLPAGKYALFTIFNGNDVTLIFNKTFNQWGAFDYKQADDALRVKATASVADPAAEQMIFTINPQGVAHLMWGAKKVSFNLK